MYTLILILFLIVCILMTITILMQSSKGGGLAGAFGGAGAGMGSVFGGRGAATFLSKATAVLAAAFFLLAFILSYMDSGSSANAPAGIVEQELQKQQSEQVLPPLQESIPAVQTLEQIQGEASSQADTSSQ